MSDKPSPFLLKFWWLLPALLAAAGAVAAWFYRERPIGIESLPTSVVQSAVALEGYFSGPPARRVEYRVNITTEIHGDRAESKIHQTAEHIGGGWIRRSDDWYDGGAPNPTYQERLLSYRNILQVHTKHRVIAPIVHALLAEFGWLVDTAHTQSAVMTGTFPAGEGSSLAVDQSRIAPVDPQTSLLKAVTYERQIVCKKDGTFDGGTFGPALTGPLTQVSCISKRSHAPGDTITVYVWHPEVRMFLLVRSEKPAAFGGTEVQTRRFESIEITP